MVPRLAPKNAITTLRTKIEEHAKSLGFDLVGFSPAKIEDEYLKVFDKWLAAGHEGTMSYMRKIEKRRDLTKILPGARSVIVLATNYYREQPRLSRSHGIVARYAYGRDYHKIIEKRLKHLENFVTEIAPEARTKAYVDTGPVLERALAEQAGIGRIGKNSCLITREFGSWVFLSEIITTLDLCHKSFRRHKTPALLPDSILGREITSPVLPLSTMPSKDQAIKAYSLSTTSIDRWSNPKALSANVCGNCTRCIDACPTGAIIAPGVIDARLCISYLTIENKDKIPLKLAKIIAKTKRLYGCDICQEVCPHNSARQKSIEPNATHRTKPDTSQDSISRALSSPRIAGSQLSLKKITAIKTDEQFLETFAGSPLMRVKRKGLARNAQIIASPK